MNTILKPLYFAISWVMIQFHTFFGLILGKHSHESLKWTLSIVGLVILIRTILIPLFVKQIKSQRAMTALQPKMKEIQKKYKDDRAKQSEEMMKLYKEHKTNPLASCFPLLAQAPIFFALFRVLNAVANANKGKYLPTIFTAQLLDTAHKAKFLGAPIADSFLSSHITSTKIVTVALIAFMSATTFSTQRQLMVKGMPKLEAGNPMVQQQKIMLYVFPVIFAISGVNFPIGVLIYWSTTNLWTFFQQLYVIKRNPTPGSPAYEELLKRRALEGGTMDAGAVVTVEEAEKLEKKLEKKAQETASRQRNQPKKKKPRK
jgi:YidC/Oxa1 family membrane protein insertase